jgi:uncharacterized protein (TIGR03067 family)
VAVRVLLFCFTCLLFAAEPRGNDADKKELDKLQGDWTMVSMEFRGKKASDEEVKNYKLTIKDDQWTVTVNGRDNKATIKIDPSKDPKTIDLTFTINDVISLSRGIYKLDGDTLSVCRNMGDNERPKEFKTSEEAGGGLVVWKRASK